MSSTEQAQPFKVEDLEPLLAQYSGKRWRAAEYGEPSVAGGISPLPFRSERIILPSWKCDISGPEVGAGWT